MLGGALKGFWKSSQRVAQGFWNVVDKVDTKGVGRKIGGWADRASTRWTATAANAGAGTALAPYSKGRAMWGAATAPFTRHPGLTKTAAITGAGAYGYASGEGTTGQRLERGLGFAAGVGLGATKTGRGLMKSIVNPKIAPSAATGMVPYSATGAGMSRAGAIMRGARGVGIGAGAGAMYGAINEDTTILGGVATGAGAALLGKGAVKGWARGHRIGMRTGAAAGGAVGMYAGGPVGMAIGAGIGGTVGGVARFARRYPTAAKYAAGTALVGGMSTAIVGSAAANAYAMHQQPRQTNYGADGDLALGLHALRHG